MMKTVCCLLLFMVFSSCAKQLMFNKEVINDDYKFDYKWVNGSGVEHAFSFALDADTVNNHFRHFKALRPSLLYMHSLRKLQQAAAELDPRKGVVNIYSIANKVEYDIRSSEPNWAIQQSAKLESLYESALAEYLYQEYYTEFTGFYYQPDGRSYKPDHIRFAKESSQALQPLLDEIRKKMPRATARNIAVFLLSWLQTIPYEAMEPRAQYNGANFAPPLKLLRHNKGDCDSKVTLMATIMKAMFPRLKIALIYLPEHTLIGMNVSHLEEDEKLKLDGLDYTLADPVGPKLLPFAEISEQSKRYISSGNYQVELL